MFLVHVLFIFYISIMEHRYHTTGREHGRFWAWIFFTAVCLALYCFVCTAQQRALAADEYKRQNIVVVKGTVMHADCTFDPATQTIECTQLIVMYPGVDGNNVTKTFEYAATAPNIQKVPQIGMTVLVSYTRTAPDTTAYVMSLE